MKIAILSLGLGTNYGGILQSYALQTVLQRMGHQVEVIDSCKTWKLPFWKKILSYPYRFLLKYCLGRKGLDVFIEREHNKTYPVITQNIYPFINKYISRREIRDFSEIKEEDYDAFVVGSDQVWRKRYFCGAFFTHIENAYLAFAKKWNVTRIAYAASFGTSAWEYSEKDTESCGELLKLFSKVSLREASGVELCKKKFQKECSLVLDPTLLLQKTDYENVIVSSEVKKNAPIICYILDMTDEKAAFIKRFSKSCGKEYTIINSFKVQDVHANLEERIQPSIESWLSSFMQAEFVITDSYHACVFSVIFEKPFYVFASKNRGIARYESLLGLLGLRDRLIDPSTPFTVKADINFEQVGNKLDRERINSLDFLKNGLS